MGQSNLWYADKPDIHRQFRLDVLRYIETRVTAANEADVNLGYASQPDPLLRRRVEEAAGQLVFVRYARLGYRVESVEKDNVGWDLNAVLEQRHLKLEVKGLSDIKIESDLTPKEYAMMKAHRETYRLCVVTQALTEPK